MPNGGHLPHAFSHIGRTTLQGASYAGPVDETTWRNTTHSECTLANPVVKIRCSGIFHCSSGTKTYARTLPVRQRRCSWERVFERDNNEPRGLQHVKASLRFTASAPSTKGQLSSMTIQC